MRRITKFLANIAILAMAVCLGLLFCEFAARRILNPADFLRLEMVPDNVLGMAPSSSARAAFDKWGFRNRGVPETADVVAVGDSHTYGNTARMEDSWPYVLGNLNSQHVYNMGLGGYGPNQYFYLSNTKAFSLKPRMIIWGLYMGDDFENAFSITYGLDYWAALRNLPPQQVDPNIWESPSSDKWDNQIRVWLSRHSVIYQVAFHTGFGGRVKGAVQIQNATKFYPGLDTSLIIPEKHIQEAFRPEGILARLDQDNPSIREGMRITFELLKKMNETCQQNRTQFLVVVIPTKEMVFSNYLEHDTQLPLHDVVEKLLANERSARSQLFNFMTVTNIPYVDTLPALEESSQKGLYAVSAVDMHPNKNGYRVIAEAVSEALKRREGRN